MSDGKLRRGIIVEAARMMYERRESEYYRAKMKAARRLCQGWVKPSELPSNAEIRDEVQRMAALFEGGSRFDRLREMRVEALRIMRLVSHCRPKIIGSTFTGHIRQGSDIDIHVFSSSLEAVTGCLDAEGMDYEVEHKRVRKHGEERVFTHIHIRDRFPIELTMYPPDKVGFVFKSSITGKAMERASLAEFEQFLRTEYPDADLEDEVAADRALLLGHARRGDRIRDALLARLHDGGVGPMGGGAEEGDGAPREHAQRPGGGGRGRNGVFHGAERSS